MSVDVLIPRVVTADGEWQAWNKGRDLPGAYRSRSFREMLTGNDPGIHEQRVLDHPVWPNKTVEAYIAALDDADSRVRRQAVVACTTASSDRTVVDDAIIPAMAYLTNPYWHNPRVPLPASTNPLLIEAVATGSLWVRAWAARALRYVATPDDRVIAAQAAAQQDNDEDVGRAAEESLRMLSNKGWH